MRVLTDPGAWTDAQNTLRDIDLIVITHEHADHFHVESLSLLLANNPKAQLVTNSAVAKLLPKQAPSPEIIEDGDRSEATGIAIAGFGTQHASIYSALAPVMNTGYLFGDRFFYPGDALTRIDVAVDILAMPMIGPWMKLGEAIDWALALQPTTCIPVHDGMLDPRTWIYNYPTQVLADAKIVFDPIEPGETKEY